MAEPTFIPKPGQVDYANIRYAPCVKVIPVYKGKVLLVRRTEDRRLYPGYWDVINGFLDDHSSIEKKATEELREEAGIRQDDIVSFKRGQASIIEDPEYNKTWLIVPILAEIKTATFTLDWEATEAAWFTPGDVAKKKLIPGTSEIIAQFFPGMAGRMV